MSVVQDVIKEEYNRLIELIEQYDQKIADYPKGSISVKSRRGKPYYYLSFREGDKVKSVYLGKEDSSKVIKYSEQIKKRQRYEELRKQAKKNLNDIRKLLHVAQ